MPPECQKNALCIKYPTFMMMKTDSSAMFSQLPRVCFLTIQDSSAGRCRVTIGVMPEPRKNKPSAPGRFGSSLQWCEVSRKYRFLDIPCFFWGIPGFSLVNVAHQLLGVLGSA